AAAAEDLFHRRDWSAARVLQYPIRAIVRGADVLQASPNTGQRHRTVKAFGCAMGRPVSGPEVAGVDQGRMEGTRRSAFLLEDSPTRPLGTHAGNGRVSRIRGEWQGKSLCVRACCAIPRVRQAGVKGLPRLRDSVPGKILAV